MLWLNSSREQIKSDNPGISVTEIAKKGGEMWKEMKDKSEWEGKSNKLKKEYAEAMKTYEASDGAKNFKEKSAKTAKSESKKNKKEASSSSTATVSPSKTMSGSAFKSKEYISDDSSSEGGSDSGKSKSKSKSKSKPKSAAKNSESEENEPMEEDGSEGETKKAATKKTEKRPSVRISTCKIFKNISINWIFFFNLRNQQLLGTVKYFSIHELLKWYWQGHRPHIEYRGMSGIFRDFFVNHSIYEGKYK